MSAGQSSSLKGKPFNFYVHRAVKTDDSASPPGCDSIMVLVPCATLVRNKDLASLPRGEAIENYKQQFNADVVNDARDAVLQRLSVLKGLKNLRDEIVDEVVDTPGSYADYYNVAAGVPFGLVRLCSKSSLIFCLLYTI
jgi:phytoene desaturase (3,4-didehydrolycopene-forming)